MTLGCLPAGTFDVLLAGYFGFGNLGDELLARSAVERLIECGVERKRIAILSATPVAARDSLGISAFDRWRIPAVRAAVAASGSLLFAGGGLFQDASSLRSPFYYWWLVRLAGALKKKVWALGQSVGPLRSGLARWLARNALSRCAYLAVRDEISHVLLDSMGVRAETMPDLVLGFRPPDHANPADSDGEILVNLRPTRRRGDALAAIAHAVRCCAEGGRSLRGVAFAEEDRAEFIRLQQSGEIPAFPVVRVDDMDAFGALARDACGGLGMRLHFGVLSVFFGLRALLSSYDPKVEGFARQWGIGLLENKKGTDNFFDIMQLLTASPTVGREELERARAAVVEQFRIGLGCVFGG